MALSAVVLGLALGGWLVLRGSRFLAGPDDGSGSAANRLAAVAATVDSNTAPLPGKPDPERVATCGACAARKCGTVRAACEAEPACGARLACTRACSDPDCLSRCESEHPLIDEWRSPTRDGAAAYDAYRVCVYDTACLAECGRGDNYACTGQYQWARPSGDIPIELVVTPSSGVHAIFGVAGIEVRVCDLLNDSCPVTPATVTDNRGLARFDVTPMPGGPFTGFIEWQGRGRHWLWFEPPLVRSVHRTIGPNPGTNAQAFEFTGGALGTKLDIQTTGIAFVVALDCAGAWAGGLRFSLNPAPAGAIRYYYKDRAWSRLVEATERTPIATAPGPLNSGGFAGVPPGRYLLRAERAASELLAEREFLVRAGAITVVILSPRSR